MYPFVCFILLVSLEGIKTDHNKTNDVTTMSNKNEETDANNSVETPVTMYINSNETPTTVHTSSTGTCNTNSYCQTNANCIKASDCLINLVNMKENLLFFIIAFLLLVCILLLLIIMCLACKRCRGVRNDKMVIMKSSRRSSVNGGPSEVEVRYSSVKVEIETTPDEEQERTPEEEVGGAAAEVRNQVKENQNSASDTTETSETAPTQEVDQSGQTDLKIEDLEKAE
ncbi:uncharacterized protein LOC131366535 [Hemibagrus wyckioides]|uniref:uncharacterized protein LOC131366535 n=1 Tax=Hemibagrus wyckioides TaxID=337641 RepID=UPI00266B8E88|nr:uncharacterized protein LOC131366535 [Hemibagrus wyckioides]